MPFGGGTGRTRERERDGVRGLAGGLDRYKYRDAAPGHMWRRGGQGGMRSDRLDDDDVDILASAISEDSEENESSSASSRCVFVGGGTYSFAQLAVGPVRQTRAAVDFHPRTGRVRLTTRGEKRLDALEEEGEGDGGGQQSINQSTTVPWQEDCDAGG